MANETANTPNLSETELREMRIGDLRERARAEGIPGADERRHEELVDAISAKYRERAGRSVGGAAGAAGAGGRSGNEPGTPDLSETDLRATGIDELRSRARREGVDGAEDLRKEELVRAISAKHRGDR